MFFFAKRFYCVHDTESKNSIVLKEAKVLFIPNCEQNLKHDSSHRKKIGVELSYLKRCASNRVRFIYSQKENDCSRVLVIKNVTRLVLT